MPYIVYIIYSQVFDRYYIGQTNDIDNRLKFHNCGYGKATSPYIPWKVKCLIEKNTRSDALLLEKKLKNLNKDKLIRFINKYS